MKIISYLEGRDCSGNPPGFPRRRWTRRGRGADVHELTQARGLAGEAVEQGVAGGDPGRRRSLVASAGRSGKTRRKRVGAGGRRGLFALVRGQDPPWNALVVRQRGKSGKYLSKLQHRG
jgi:hypothetical protein